jgi:hypothetical protein
MIANKFVWIFLYSCLLSSFIIRCESCSLRSLMLLLSLIEMFRALSPNTEVTDAEMCSYCHPNCNAYEHLRHSELQQVFRNVHYIRQMKLGQHFDAWNGYVLSFHYIICISNNLHPFIVNAVFHSSSYCMGTSKPPCRRCDDCPTGPSNHNVYKLYLNLTMIHFNMIFFPVAPFRVIWRKYFENLLVFSGRLLQPKRWTAFIALYIFYLGTSWRPVVSFNLQPLYHKGKVPSAHW